MMTIKCSVKNNHSHGFGFFVITEILWCMGFRYYTRFIVVGVILAELLQLVTIFRNMVETESYRKIKI